MKICRELMMGLVLAGAASFMAGCGKKAGEPSPTAATAPRHEHTPPHGGAPVVLGNEAYHLELVLDASEGKLAAYLLDGEMENFIRIVAPSIEIAAQVNGASQTLVLRAVSNSATGETVGDTALFEARAEWLKTIHEFDGTVKAITVRGTTFTDVKFNFPHGNDKD